MPNSLTAHRPYRTVPENAGRTSEELPIALLGLALLYAILSPLFRSIGPAALLPAAACVGAFALLYARRYFQLGLMLLAGIGLFWTLLSYTDLLHGGITRMFDRGAIAQQMFYTVFVVFLMPALMHYHARVAAGHPSWLRFELCILICAFLAQAWYALAGGFLVGLQGIGISQFMNADAIAAFIIARRWLFSGRMPHMAAIALAMLLMVTAASFQSFLVMFAGLALIAFPRLRQPITTAFLLLIILVPIAAMPFAAQIVLWEPNTGIRLVFWNEALERLWQSHFIGVGFGTETVRSNYEFAGKPVHISGAESGRLIFVGSHNAIVDAAYRMGIVGGLTLVIYIAAQFRKTIWPNGGKPSLMDCWAACALAMTLMANVSLASINFLFGTAFFLSWLAYRAGWHDRSANRAKPRRAAERRGQATRKPA